MSETAAKSTSDWILAGLIALPVYGLLTAWSSLTPQPDQTTDPQGWAEFVSADSYLVSHVLGSIGGTVLAILGFFALGAHFSRSLARGMALTSMVVTVTGQALLLIPASISAFATPAIGQAYLDGLSEVMQIEFPAAMTWSFLLGLLLAFVGSILFGVVMIRTGMPSKVAGAVWIVATVVFYPLGVVLGMATTGSSLPTQSIGALLLAVVAGWIVWGAMRERSSDREETRA